ncbi:hypothetical protein HNP11_000427 [Tsukamurella ocularis]|nr:hypothetical protein [Tsukamurella ocularis]MCS3786274.1 hypothetical protein [Tsukamurella ocularis]
MKNLAEIGQQRVACAALNAGWSAPDGRGRAAPKVVGAPL